MRLLIVTRERAGDARFGLGKAVRRIAQELRNRGHAVELISAEDWTEADEARQRSATRLLGRMGAPEPLAAALAQRWVQARRARKLLQSGDFTHLWLQDPWLAIGYLGLRPLSRTPRRVRWGLSEHGYGSFARAVALDGLVLPSHWRRLLLGLEAWTLRRADFVLLPTGAVERQLLDELGMQTPPKHWAVLGYGRPEAPAVSRVQARQGLGWTETGFYALVLGRTAPVKRVDLIVQACLLAQQAGMEVRLVVVGGQLPGDLSAMAAMLTQPPICVEVDDPAVYLAAVDVYVSACAVESFGLANLEAIAAGLPCVVAHGGGAPEVLAQGAWWVEPVAEPIAQALCQLAQNEALRTRWAAAASSRAAQIPTWSELGEVYEKHIAGA